MSPPRSLKVVLLILAASTSLILCLGDRALVREVRPGDVGSEEAFEGVLSQFEARTLPGPFGYRILVPACVTFVSENLHVTPIWADFAAKFLFLTFAQVLFFLYLRKFTGITEAGLGVFFFLIYAGASLSSSAGPSVFDTIDLLNVCVYVAALLALKEDRFGSFVLLLAAGMLNRETPILLAMVPWFLDGATAVRIRRTALSAAAVAIPYVLVRLLVPTPNDSWFLTVDIGRNIPFVSSSETAGAFAVNIKLASVIGVPLALAGVGFKSSHPFLRAASSIVLPFIAVHYVFGRIAEIRLWLPLLVILIPLALGGIAVMESRHGPR